MVASVASVKNASKDIICPSEDWMPVRGKKFLLEKQEEKEVDSYHANFPRNGFKFLDQHQL